MFYEEFIEVIYMIPIAIIFKSILRFLELSNILKNKAFLHLWPIRPYISN